MSSHLPEIRISQPQLGPDVESLVLDVLRSGHVAQGPRVEEFEAMVATMAGASHAIAVANGTVALEAALEVTGIGPGDEVITSPLTFSATLNAILGCGAVARFVEVADDYTLDPVAVIAALTPRTRAIMPVHLYGLIADMENLASAASAHGAVMIEDAAQAHGSAQNGRAAGSFGTGCFSFYATKNITSAEGGMVTTSDGAIAATLRTLRNQGMRARYDYVEIGHNWRLTDLAAAVAIPQMRRLDEITAQRVHNATALSQLLAGTELVLPTTPHDRTHVWHQYTVLLPPTVDRDAVIAAMAELGVASGAYYPRMVWDYPPYRDHPRVISGDTPWAREVAARCLSLPVHPGLSSADLERIAAALRGAVEVRSSR